MIFRKQGRKQRKPNSRVTYTDEPEVVSNMRRSKRKKRRNIPYSSPAASDLSDNDGQDSDLQLNIPSPPSGSLFSGVRTREKEPVSSQPSCSKNLDFGSTPPHHSLAIYTSTPIDCFIPSQPSGSKNLDREYTPSHHSRAIYENTPISHTKNTQYSGFEEVLLRKIENVKELCDETNRLFHALLAEKNKPAEDLTSIENFPFCLPCKSLQDVEIVEEFLKDPESRKNFVTHLAVIGGTNAEKHVRRILCSAFTNELAQQYNWSGKGGKRALKDLVIPSVIIDAVKRNKRNFSGTTICELENVIKQWFRFAKDRQGGRDKRRSLEILK